MLTALFAVPGLVLWGPQPVADVPFELRGVHMFVQAKINGQGPFEMNVDTGGILGVTGLLARQLGLKGDRDVAGGGAGAKAVTFHWGKVGTVEIGGAKLENLEGSIGEGGDSLSSGIGADLFERFTVEFDNDHRRMRLYAKGQAPIRTGAAAIPLKLTREGKPLAEVGVGDVRGRFMLDTGGGVSIILQKAFWTKHGLKARFKPPITTIIGYGIGGPIYGSVGRIPALRFGTLDLREPVATYSTMTKGTLSDPERDGLIGQRILLHFNSVFDYANHRLLLTPSRTFAKRDAYSRTGMSGQVEGLGYRVEAVIPRGPAADAGLRVGDVIVRIEGGFVASDEEARSALAHPAGTRLKLEILRGDRTFEATLRLRDIL